MEKIFTNNSWKSEETHCFTVITPLYNRSKTIERTIKSVERQDFRDFEYIIIDDGSTDDPDQIVLPFLNNTDIPVLYVKKENGGVHTARNAGIMHARGKLLVNIDSDDELLPSALTTFYDAWNSIPEAKRDKYREVVGRCKDQDGNEVGEKFPAGINRMPWKDALKACEDAGGEHEAAMVTKILQENQFPEVEGVTFLTENILWVKLFHMYKSWFINDIVRVYHSDGDGHLSTNMVHPKKTLQNCRNAMYESMYVLNHFNIYHEFFDYKTTLLRYCIMQDILKRHHDKYYRNWKLSHTGDRRRATALSVPALILSMVYEKRRM